MSSRGWGGIGLPEWLRTPTTISQSHQHWLQPEDPPEQPQWRPNLNGFGFGQFFDRNNPTGSGPQGTGHPGVLPPGFRPFVPGLVPGAANSTAATAGGGSRPRSSMRQPQTPPAPPAAAAGGPSQAGSMPQQQPAAASGSSMSGASGIGQQQPPPPPPSPQPRRSSAAAGRRKVPCNIFPPPTTGSSRGGTGRPAAHSKACDSDGWPAPPTHINKLPQDALLHVLRFLDLRHLLQCSAVCKAWQAAAQETAAQGVSVRMTHDSMIDNIVTLSRGSFPAPEQLEVRAMQKWVATSLWLAQHSSSVKLTSLNVEVLGRAFRDDDTARDAEKGLQAGSWEHGALLLSAMNPLASLTQLTSLQVGFGAISLRSLAACSSLRALKLHFIEVLGLPKYHTTPGRIARLMPAPGQDWIPLPRGVTPRDQLMEAPECPALTVNAALPSLPHLTSLHITGGFSGLAVLVPATGLVIPSSTTGLEDLHLTACCTPETLASLPPTLTSLKLGATMGILQLQVAPHTAPAVCRLTALRELSVVNVQLDADVLLKLTQLSKLELEGVLLNGPVGSRTEAFTRLQQLRHLQFELCREIGELEPWEAGLPAGMLGAMMGNNNIDDASLQPLTAGELSALLASTQLTHLNLGVCLPMQGWQAAAADAAAYADAAFADAAYADAAAVAAMMGDVDDLGAEAEALEGIIAALDAGEVDADAALLLAAPLLDAPNVEAAAPGGPSLCAALPTGHLLPHLTSLDLGAGLLQSAADVSQVAECCPGLKRLFIKGCNVGRMHWHCEAVSAATRERLASQSARLDVLQISQLTGLQELCVQGFNMRGAVQGLLQLKQLQGLSARLCVGEEPWAYQKLTVLTKLERLSLGQFKPDIFVSIFGMAAHVYRCQHWSPQSAALLQLHAARSVAGQLPGALKLYDNVPRVAKLLQQGAQPFGRHPPQESAPDSPTAACRCCRTFGTDCSNTASGKPPQGCPAAVPLVSGFTSRRVVPGSPDSSSSSGSDDWSNTQSQGWDYTAVPLPPGFDASSSSFPGAPDSWGQAAGGADVWGAGAAAGSAGGNDGWAAAAAAAMGPGRNGPAAAAPGFVDMRAATAWQGAAPGWEAAAFAAVASQGDDSWGTAAHAPYRSAAAASRAAAQGADSWGNAGQGTRAAAAAAAGAAGVEDAGCETDDWSAAAAAAAWVEGWLLAGEDEETEWHDAEEDAQWYQPLADFDPLLHESVPGSHGDLRGRGRGARGAGRGSRQPGGQRAAMGSRAAAATAAGSSGRSGLGCQPSSAGSALDSSIPWSRWGAAAPAAIAAVWSPDAF